MKILKELCMKKGILLKDFAREFNVSNATVSKWISGKAEPHSQTQKKIADFFGVSIDYLLGYEGKKEEKMEFVDVPDKDDRSIYVSDEEFNLIKNYRKLSWTDKYEVNNFISFKLQSFAEAAGEAITKKATSSRAE